MPCGSVRSFRWWMRNLPKWPDESSRFNGDSRMLHSMRRDGFEGRHCSNDIIGRRVSMRCGLFWKRNDVYAMPARFYIFIGRRRCIMLRSYTNMQLGELCYYNTCHENRR